MQTCLDESLIWLKGALNVSARLFGLDPGKHGKLALSVLDVRGGNGLYWQRGFQGLSCFLMCFSSTQTELLITYLHCFLSCSAFIHTHTDQRIQGTLRHGWAANRVVDLRSQLIQHWTLAARPEGFLNNKIERLAQKTNKTFNIFPGSLGYIFKALKR